MQTKKGSGIIHLTGTTKNLKNPMSIPYSTLHYHLTKNRKKAGQPHPTKEGHIILPEPQAVVLIVRIHGQETGMKSVSFVSPPDMIVNTKNTRDFVGDTLADLEDRMFEMSEKYGYEDDFDTDRINDYSIKFIY